MLKPALSNNELVLIRHAPAATNGCLAGRRDVGIEPVAPAIVDRLRNVFRQHDIALVSSPAIRCRETSAMICPGITPALEEDLWEQNFGNWEGLPFAELPDLGELSGEALANHRPPEGESFEDLCTRVQPVFSRLSLDIHGSEKSRVVVAHSGVIRGALAMVTGASASFRFEIAHLSITRLRCLPDGSFSVILVNGNLL